MAHEVLGFRFALLGVVRLLLAVDQSTKVGHFAGVAHVEGAAMVSKLLRLAVVEVARRRKSLILKNALFLSVDEGFFFDLFLQADEWSEFLSDGARDVLGHLDFMLAARAGHEGECDAQGRPSVLEELYDAIGVESVATGEPGAALGAELARVANGAKFVCVDTFEVSSGFGTLDIEARHAMAFLRITKARVAALESLAAEGVVGHFIDLFDDFFLLVKVIFVIVI